MKKARRPRPPAYEKSPFIRIQNEVALANIVGSNFVDLNFTQGVDGKIIAQGALDKTLSKVQAVAPSRI